MSLVRILESKSLPNLLIKELQSLTDLKKREKEEKQ